ncbi:Histidine kinase [Eubacterium ruminantium]|nr:Histidine kinase [Eubacterium ruminantium]
MTDINITPEMLNMINMILVVTSTIMSLTILFTAIRMKKHNRRMGWFIASLCVVMTGLKSQITSENIFHQEIMRSDEGYLARSLIFFSLVAPLFCLYFIETEGEQKGKWDSFFWAMLQTLIAVLIIILVAFKRAQYFIYLGFLVQFIIIIVMLMLSAKDIKESMRFMMGLLFPITATLIGMSNTSVNFMGVGMVMLMLVVFFGYQMDMESELLKNQVELSENKLAVLMEQIHPHFIYNSLQQIALLCDEDSEAVKPAIYNFSSYLRKNFESLTNVGMIPFEREMEHVDMFVALSQILPSRKFEVKKEFGITDFCLPALTLQPLVENAIQYGIAMNTEGDRILIETKAEGGYIIIRVVDDGHGKETKLPTQKKHKSVGTQNVKSRLKVLCDGTLSINRLEQGTEAVIRIPQMKAKNDKEK